MSEFNDFLKAIAEGKKQTIESNPGKKALKQLEESLHQDNPFLTLLAERPVVEVQNTPTESTEPKPEVVGEFILEQGTFTHASDLNEVVVPEVKPASQIHSQSEIDKYLKRNASFQQPEPDKIDPNMRAVQDKLKFLEQAIGRIAATGPGGGAGEVYNLDMPTKAVTGDYTINRKDYYIGVNADVKTYITLPTEGRNLKNGRVVVIKDESGHAQLTPIKVVGTIDGDPNGAEIRINNGALQLIYRDGSWRII